MHYFTEPQEWELYDLKTDPNEDNNLYGKPGQEALTAQLKDRITALRKELGDAYEYTPSRTPVFKSEMLPPTKPRPWRPNNS